MTDIDKLNSLLFINLLTSFLVYLFKNDVLITRRDYIEI